MLTLNVKGSEFYDQKKNLFFEIPDTSLRLEYSLAAISKYETIVKKPFFTKAQKTKEEYLCLIKCMNLDADTTDPLVYSLLTPDHYKQIVDYISEPMSARTYRKEKNEGYRYITSEDFYYQMFSNNIPLECENWHFNKLLAIIKLFNIRNQAASGKKVSDKELYKTFDEINAQRRKAMNSKG